MERLETARLILRLRNQKQLQELLTLPNSEQMAYLGYDSLQELEQEQERIKRLITLNREDWKKWDIIDKAKEQVVGNCDFHNWSA